jgi:hypothetical protein
MKFKAFIAAGAMILAVAGPALAAPDVNGTWTGQANQVNRDKPFAVIMTITAKGGEIQYPDSNCSGTLTRAGSSGDYVFFVEKITKNAFDAAKNTGCLSGSLSVQRTKSGMVLGWFGSHDGRPVVVYATMTKAATEAKAAAAKPAASR